MKLLRRTTVLALITITTSVLVACGGGTSNTPTFTAVDLPPIALSSSNAALAKAVGAALAGKSLSITGSSGFIDPATNQAPANFPTSTLTFSALPSNPPAGAIASVTLANAHYSATGFAFPGSLGFLFNQLVWVGTPVQNIYVPRINTTFTPLQTNLWTTIPTPDSWSWFTPTFEVDMIFLPTGNYPYGGRPYTANVTIGNEQVTTEITATASSTDGNTVTLDFGGGATLSVEKASATGATGSTGATGATGSIN